MESEPRDFLTKFPPPHDTSSPSFFFLHSSFCFFSSQGPLSKREVIVHNSIVHHNCSPWLVFMGTPSHLLFIHRLLVTTLFMKKFCFIFIFIFRFRVLYRLKAEIVLAINQRIIDRSLLSRGIFLGFWACRTCWWVLFGLILRGSIGSLYVVANQHCSKWSEKIITSAAYGFWLLKLCFEDPKGGLVS